MLSEQCPDIGQPGELAAAQIATRHEGTRSPAPATDPAIPIWRSVTPGANGPRSGCRASAPVPRPSRRLRRSTGHHTACQRTCALQFGGQIRGERVGGLQHRVHQRTERRPSRQDRPSATAHRHRMEPVPPARYRPTSSSSSTTSGSLDTAADLLGRAHQTRVGGAPPRRCRWSGGSAAPPDRLGAPGAGRSGDDGSTTDSSSTGPPASSQARSRASASSSETFGGATAGGHLGLARGAAAQQPRQPAVGFVPGRRPPRHHLRLGPRQRHIGQPAVVGGGLGLARLATARSDRRPADVQAACAVVVEQHRIRFR